MARSLETAWLLEGFNYIIKDQSSFHFSMLPVLMWWLSPQAPSFILAKWLLKILTSHKELRRGLFPFVVHLPLSKIPSRITPLAPIVSCAQAQVTQTRLIFLGPKRGLFSLG